MKNTRKKARIGAALTAALLGIALLGGLLTMASAVRVLYPALAGSWQMSAGQIGLLYAAIPLGAALGALTSGQPWAIRWQSCTPAWGISPSSFSPKLRPRR